MKHQPDVAALFRALTECFDGDEKAIGAEWQPNMKPESSEAEARKVGRGERLEAAMRLLAVLARRGQIKPLIEALEALEVQVSLTDLIADVRRIPKQLEMFGGEFIELVARVAVFERALRTEHIAEVLPLKRKPSG